MPSFLSIYFGGRRPGEPNRLAPESREYVVTVIETERLRLRKLTTADAAFILELLNEPSFIRYIGDKGVSSLDDACRYILTGPVESYDQHGYGLYLVELKKIGMPIGISGLVKRPALRDADLGFAFLPSYWSKGYASESASAVMAYGRDVLGLNRILGITSPDNERSMKVLRKVGLRYDRMVKLSEAEPEVRLFTSDLSSKRLPNR